MKKVKAAFRGIVIFLLCMIEIYPLFWMLTASFKKQAEWSEKPAYALNDGFYFQNYSDAWTRGHMSTFFKNSLITTLVALVFIVFFSVTVGFAVTKMKWKFRNAVAQYFRFGIMIPVAIALISIVTVLVLQFFFKWNDLLFSMTFISDSALKTVQTGLLYFSDEFGSKNWGAIFASVSMSVFPLLILYMALNKKLMEGMTAGAVKG